MPSIKDILERRQRAAEMGKEIEVDSYRCFCCKDTGYVNLRNFVAPDEWEHQMGLMAVACTCPAGIAHPAYVERCDDVTPSRVAEIDQARRDAMQLYISDRVHRAEIKKQQMEALAQLKMKTIEGIEATESARLLTPDELAAIESNLQHDRVAAPAQNDDYDIPF